DEGGAYLNATANGQASALYAQALFTDAFSITANSVTANSICDLGSTTNVTVNFSTGGNNGSSTYTFQLSSSSGSFASPTSIGSSTFTGNQTNQNTTCTVPTGLTAGTGYLIRIVSGATVSGNLAFTISAPPTTATVAT